MKTYLVRLCTDGEFHAQTMCGPGGWCAKVYKTEAGARRNNPGSIVEPVKEKASP